jgi:hypothetical protein
MMISCSTPIVLWIFAAPCTSSAFDVQHSLPQDAGLKWFALHPSIQRHTTPPARGWAGLLLSFISVRACNPSITGIAMIPPGNPRQLLYKAFAAHARSGKARGPSLGDSTTLSAAWSTSKPRTPAICAGGGECPRCLAFQRLDGVASHQHVAPCRHQPLAVGAECHAADDRACLMGGHMCHHGAAGLHLLFHRGEGLTGIKPEGEDFRAVLRPRSGLSSAAAPFFSIP